MAPGPPRRLAALVGGFVAAYLALFALALGSGGLIALERVLTRGALATMTTFGDPLVLRHVTVERMDAYVRYDITVSTRDGRRNVVVKHAFHAHNLLLFLALVGVTPGLPLRRRAAAALLGCAAIFVVDVVIVVGDLLSVEDSVLDVVGPGNVAQPLKWIASALRYSQPTGGAFMVPVFIWGLMLATLRPGENRTE